MSDEVLTGYLLILMFVLLGAFLGAILMLIVGWFARSSLRSRIERLERMNNALTLENQTKFGPQNKHRTMWG